MRTPSLPSAPPPAKAPPPRSPATGPPAAEPAARTGRRRSPEAIIPQTAWRHYESRMIAAIGPDHATRVRVGIKPDHATFGRQPFDAVMPSPHRVSIGPFGVKKPAGPSAPDSGQDTVERLKVVPRRRSMAFLR